MLHGRTTEQLTIVPSTAHELLRAAREERRLDLEHAARWFGVSRETYAGWERGKRPSATARQLIAVLFGVPSHLWKAAA